MKAILITKSNQQRLANQWNVEPTDLDDMLPIGYWLVAEFGAEKFVTLTPEEVGDNWTVVLGLENGYVDIIKNEA